MHSLIIGMTESGKTTLAKLICRELTSRGKKTAVLDPLHDPDWGSDFQTSNPEEFLKWAKGERDAFLFVDEGGDAIGRYNVPMNWLTTTSRHWGHSSFLICHGLTSLSPIIRNNCGRCYLFTCADSVSRIVAEEYNEKALKNADRLEKGEFYIVSRFGAVKKFRIKFDTMEVTTS